MRGPPAAPPARSGGCRRPRPPAPPRSSAQPRRRAGIGMAQDLRPQRRARRLRGPAGHEGLPRGRAFAGIRGQRGIRPDQRDRRDRQAQRIGADLRDHGVRALADIGRALMQHQPPVRREAEPDRRGVGQARYCRSHTSTTPRPRRATPPLARCGAPRPAPASQGARSASQAVADSGRDQHLPGRRQRRRRGRRCAAGTPAGRSRPPRRAGRRAFPARSPPAARQSRERRRTTGPLVCTATARRHDVRRPVGARGMHRHPVRHRRAPAGIGAGVEDAVELPSR